MKRVICILLIMGFTMFGFSTLPAHAISDEDLLAKIENMEKQIAELRSELKVMKEQKVAAVPEIKEEKKSAAPYFSAMPELKFYGFLKADFIFDDSRTNDPDATGYVLSESAAGSDNQFTATPKNSRLGLDMKGPEIWDGRVNGKVEIDFFDPASENSFKPRVRHLFIDLAFPSWSALFGQTWDVIGPLGPSTLNTNGWLWRAGNIGYRRPQARLTNKINLSGEDYLTTQASINRVVGISNGVEDTGEDNGWPLMEGRIAFATTRFFDRKTELGIGALYGEEEVDRTPAVSDDHWKARQWGVVADALIPLRESITLKGEAFVGSDLSAFLAGIGQGINMTKEKSIFAYGGWGQISYVFNKYITLNGGYGIDNADKNDLNSGDRTHNQVYFTNVMYSPIKNLTFGLEYSYWYTEYLNVKNGNDNKIQTSVIWNF